ncbi:conserved hypothetical protein [Uncinocarpus reesii 1704]|uniref:Small ribosomal subunit protein uS9m n=1 Tax=Uncinocarpus reesii (strain UAMH 1704) TaxID=336963 RepID=C4JP08_UNCRE|nr:uncharacterized protein UREG_03067 [Uncinocarpus reesii 1704]EEP78222.1 conserved hypothetical protein [Uncinocarpus reesii 1704]
MSWQWSEHAFRALRPSQCFSQLGLRALRHQQSSKSSRLPVHTPFRICQRRLMSTPSSEAPTEEPVHTPNNSFKAAPPINFNESNGIPARIVPASPGYFTSMPKFTDDLLLMERLWNKYSSLATIPEADVRRAAWLRLSQYNDLFQERIGNSRYEELVKIMQNLSRISAAMMPEEVKIALVPFIRPGEIVQQKTIPPTVDHLGRARGVAKRKTSTAVVWLVEGDGQIRINGKEITHAFSRIHDRESAMWALRSTNRMDKYNVWAVAKGGGVTGQAEAITRALAKALLVHEPALKPMLRKAGVVTADPRQVERKKPGLRKARKRPAWVKR